MVTWGVLRLAQLHPTYGRNNGPSSLEYGILIGPTLSLKAHALMLVLSTAVAELPLFLLRPGPSSAGRGFLSCSRSLASFDGAAVLKQQPHSAQARLAAC
jgi:hypothetical protein